MPLARILFATAMLGSTSVAGADDAYHQQIVHWRQQRLQTLTAADGWLTLVGLIWLRPGGQTLGRAADNSIVLPVGPAHLGMFTLTADDRVRLDLATDSGATVDGRAVASVELCDDRDPRPSQVRFGTSSLTLLDRSGRKALRVKDSTATTRTAFRGLDYFPVDPSWRIEARFEPFVPVHHIELATEVGTVEHYVVPGRIVFERDGQRVTLLPVIEAPGDTRLFVVFADRTSGHEAYGAARFLYLDAPRDGRVVLDFNRAYNPPCAFTAFATCPLPPPENRLPLRVTAGELKYRGEH
ncbi:MAG TPA: DUF1684 domain-containing protein [Rhodanobacteraceae bacterium]|nr:DUF1684 domain-containing protein [Rhodanobacteraceae bacterium]